MKGWDVFLVRVTPFVMYLLMVIETILCILGYDLEDFYYIHSNNVIYPAILFLISLSHKRYHCIYNRIMYIELIIVPLLNYADAKLNFIIPMQVYIIILYTLHFLTLFITAYLAIKHFKNAIRKSATPKHN